MCVHVCVPACVCMCVHACFLCVRAHSVSTEYIWAVPAEQGAHPGIRQPPQRAGRDLQGRAALPAGSHGRCRRVLRESPPAPQPETRLIPPFTPGSQNLLMPSTTFRYSPSPTQLVFRALTHFHYLVKSKSMSISLFIAGWSSVEKYNFQDISASIHFFKSCFSLVTPPSATSKCDPLGGWLGSVSHCFKGAL